jgi:hypothetical protein
MPTDTRDDYTVRALLIGGPQHNKRLNFEDGTTEYACVETSTTVGEGYSLPVPAGSGFFESKYRASTIKDENGNVLFLHESVTFPGVHRLPKAAEQARDKIARMSESLQESRARLSRTQEQLLERESEVAEYEATVERLGGMIAAAHTILGDLIDYS